MSQTEAKNDMVMSPADNQATALHPGESSIADPVGANGCSPAADPPSASPLPQPVRTEAVLTMASVVDEANHIIEATIIKPGQARVDIAGKPVTYTEEALRNSLPLWEAAACFVDHWNKSVRNIAGVFFAPWYDQGVKARLRFTDDTLYNMVARIVKDREAGLPVPDVGLSADIQVNGTASELAFTVTQVTRVISADIVFSPAAGGSFDRVLNSVLHGESAIKQDLGIEGPDHQDEAPTPNASTCHSRASGNPGGEGTGSGSPEPPPPPTQEGERLVPEKRVRDLQSAADRLRNQVKDQEATITTLQADLTQAVARYRDATLAAYPEIPADLLKGSTVAEVDASLENAQAMVDQVKKHLEALAPPREGSRASPRPGGLGVSPSVAVPAGAPARKGPDFSTMTPEEKISYGLRQHQGGRA